ncbi:MAG: recombinase family protein [Provencibacterium sp.]|jgi:site-specific DNA recombinase|nr:recombinase family protein [Provencibacterium sp.]
MDIHHIRQQLRQKSLYEIPLRVTYYARVSSESDEQLNSLGNQIQYYEDFIKKNPAWVFMPGYIDEGLSGISTRRRENFNRMVDDAGKDNFDLIITKEISRFARNTLDSIQYTRQLLYSGVGVFFQNDNINTFDEDSELRLSIMSSIAQDELRKLSSRVKFGHQQAIKNNVVLGNDRIFGYRKEHKRLVIDEQQAPMVRELFALYATDAYSMKQIETLFWNQGYRNLNGKKIAHSTMANMIANPKYKGYYVGNKVKVVDMFTKKQKFLPPEEWVMFKDETGEIVPAIVSEEVWERANTILRRRSEDVKNRQGICNHANLLTGKLFCTQCGAPYYRRESKDKRGNKNSKWVCSGKINNGKESCASFPIYESEIKPLLFEVFRDTRETSAAMIEEYGRMYRSMISDGQLSGNIAALEKKLDMANRKKAKLLELVTEGNISGSDFKELSAQCGAEAKAAAAELQELQAQQESSEEFRLHMEKIRSALQAAERDVSNGAITREFIGTFIDKIFVTPQEDGSMRLDIRIFSGESTAKYLERLKKRVSLQENAESCTGHMFKKMIEAYENSMK